MSTTLSVTTREYIDLDFLFARHPLTDNVTIKKNVNSVRQSIIHLMQLKANDKPFHPEIKSPIYDYLFENMSAAVQIVLEDEIKRYLATYEPRVVIDYVTVTYPTTNSINCEISGEIVNIASPITVNVLVDRLR
jgi:phage baseplate assembly protein W